MYKAASDFRFEFLAKVICEDPHSSGFMVELTPDRGDSEGATTPRYVLHKLIIMSVHSDTERATVR